MTDEDKTIIANLNTVISQPKPKKKVSASLVQYNGSSLGRRYALEKEMINIGRSANADITISDASVSRVHAKITLSGETATIEDSDSANGTYINNQKVSSVMTLADQDMIRLGNVILKFFSSDNIDGFIQDKIYKMATIDAGTQVYNKQYLLETLEAEFNLSRSSGRSLSIIYYDLDHFKRVNDSYGHNAGDQILKESCAIVKKIIRREDILGRFGGEEFIIVLPNTDAATAYELAERIRSGCEQATYDLDSLDQGQAKVIKHKQTISVGVSELSQEMTAPLELLEAADKKLYKSKQGGRNQVTI